MIIWACVATIVAVILMGILILYRRQVRTTCRQLAFIKANDTNMKLSGDELFKDLNALKDEMNEILTKDKETALKIKRNEELFKETITNISHDIRTPLTSLDGYFQLLGQSESEEERAGYIAIIEERIESLNSMLEELFTYTKLQNSQYEPELEEMDFGRCVYDTVFSFYEDFKAKGIEPDISFEEENFLIMGNKEAIRRALQNVIKNAKEHGAESLSLRLFQKDDNVEFVCANAVTNTSEIDMEKVFVRFYKSDVARTQSSTGLGLAIAKGLINKMNGTIEAKLEENLFSITIRFEMLAPTKKAMHTIY